MSQQSRVGNAVAFGLKDQGLYNRVVIHFQAKCELLVKKIIHFAVFQILIFKQDPFVYKTLWKLINGTFV